MAVNLAYIQRAGVRFTCPVPDSLTIGGSMVYRFHPSGYLEVKADSEDQARRKLAGCFTDVVKHNDTPVFICLVAADVLDVLDDDYNSVKFPRK